MATLFGPGWENESNGVEKIHRDSRTDVLLRPPPTSPSHTVAGCMAKAPLDLGALEVQSQGERETFR
jgi:hypothetical protein